MNISALGDIKQSGEDRIGKLVPTGILVVLRLSPSLKYMANLLGIKEFGQLGLDFEQI
ncbi:MAG: hypothetical protein M3162_06645 [Thermoproteota archaeon]|nr:hypothetical protein [Thermoproteota archaeon]